MDEQGVPEFSDVQRAWLADVHGVTLDDPEYRPSGVWWCNQHGEAFTGGSMACPDSITRCVIGADFDERCRWVELVYPASEDQ